MVDAVLNAAHVGEGYRPDHIGLGVRRVGPSDLEEIMATAEGLPAEMAGEELFEEIMDHPVFDGARVVEEDAE